LPPYALTNTNQPNRYKDRELFFSNEIFEENGASWVPFFSCHLAIILL